MLPADELRVGIVADGVNRLVATASVPPSVVAPDTSNVPTMLVLPPAMTGPVVVNEPVLITVELRSPIVAVGAVRSSRISTFPFSWDAPDTERVFPIIASL